MAKMGRPRKEINQKQFENLCAIQCTEEEISSVLDVSIDTLERWVKATYKQTFAEVFKQKRQNGRASLRRNQWKLAETNPTLSIWLGKQYLGQRDNRDVVVKQTIQQETIDAVEAFLLEDDDSEDD